MRYDLQYWAAQIMQMHIYEAYNNDSVNYIL